MRSKKKKKKEYKKVPEFQCTYVEAFQVLIRSGVNSFW